MDELIPGGSHQREDMPIWSPESLESGRISQLVQDLIPSEEVRKGRNFGVHVVEGTEPHADIARSVEAAVFEEYFGEDLEVMREGYAPYDAASTFLVALDYENAKPVGAIRLICSSEAGFKSLNDLVAPESPWHKEGDTLEQRFTEIGSDPEHTVDIGTMAVMTEYRSNHAATGASASLYSSCVQWSLATGHNRWMTIVDKKIYDMMQAWGEPFTAFQNTDWAPYPYPSSANALPVHLELHSGLERIKQFDIKMSQEHGQTMDVHGLYTRGTGLEQHFVLPEFSNDVQ